MLDVSPIQLLSSSETTGQITWSFNSANEAFDYLAVGETLTLTYTLTLSDGVNGSTPDTHDVVINITGANDAPRIEGGPDTATLTETDAALATSGSLTITDIDRTNVVNVSRTLEVSQTSTSALTTVDGVTVPSDPSASSTTNCSTCSPWMPTPSWMPPSRATLSPGPLTPTSQN